MSGYGQIKAAIAGGQGDGGDQHPLACGILGEAAPAAADLQDVVAGCGPDPKTVAEKQQLEQQVADLEAENKRLEREAKEDKAKQKTLARELEWIRAGAKARQAKQKARINAYEELASQSEREPMMMPIGYFIAKFYHPAPRRSARCGGRFRD